MAYDFTPILNAQFWNNSGREYVIALAVVIIGPLAIKLFKTFVISRLRSISKRTSGDADDMMVMLLETIHWPLYLTASVYVGLQLLDMSGIVSQAFRFLLLISVAFYLVKIAQGNNRVRSPESNPQKGERE